MSWPSRQSQAGYRPSLAPSVGQPIASGSGGGGSRASRAGLPRESIYPVPSGEYLASLEECVRATEGCVSSMDGALAKLQPGIADFPRLTRIFKIEHVSVLLGNS